MAIRYYKTTANNTCYATQYSDNSGAQIKIDNGEVINLMPNYKETAENGHWRLYSHNSYWLHNSYISRDITPVYATDKCTAPTSITLDVNTKILTISGGAGGDLNDFTGYRVRWRDALIGEEFGGTWSESVVVASTNTTATYEVTAPPGYVRQFAARTIGSAGSEYYSNYVICSTTLTGNTAPSTPSIIFPTNGKTTYSTTPVIGVNCPADVDGDTMSLYRKIDSESWESIGTLISGNQFDALPSLSTGEHTVYYKLADDYEESESVSVMFTVSELEWTRTISTGTVISNKNISHKADIDQMLTVLNTQCEWYGNSPIEFIGTLGRFGDWKAQMEQMEAAISSNVTTAGKTVTFDTVPSYPTASVINEIRAQLTAL